MLARSEDVMAGARKLLGDIQAERSPHDAPGPRETALEVAMHAYAVSPTAQHYDHLWSLLHE